MMETTRKCAAGTRFHCATAAVLMPHAAAILAFIPRVENISFSIWSRMIVSLALLILYPQDEFYKMIKTIQDQHVPGCYKLSMAKRIPVSSVDAEKALLIGERIKKARLNSGLTQLMLAARVKKTPGAFSQYETGRNFPKIDILERIAAELDVSTEWLMTGDEPDEKLKAQTNTERDALSLLRTIPSELHEAAIAMLRGLAKPEKKQT